MPTLVSAALTFSKSCPCESLTILKMEKIVLDQSLRLPRMPALQTLGRRTAEPSNTHTKSTLNGLILDAFNLTRILVGSSSLFIGTSLKVRCLEQSKKELNDVLALWAGTDFPDHSQSVGAVLRPSNT